MSKARRPSWLQRGQVIRTVVAAVSPLAMLLPAVLLGADSATAAPAAAYTASRIPTTGLDAFSIAVDSAAHTTYVAELLPAELTVIDNANNTVSGTIPLAGSPRGVAIDPKTDTIYVSLFSMTATNAPAVEVISGADPSQVQTIPLPVGSGPAGIAVDTSTKTVYVAEESAAAVAAIAEGSSSVTKTVSMGTGTRPFQLAVDETLGAVWVADANGEVQEISEASDSVTQTITLGGAAVDSIAVDSATDTVYAAMPANGLAVISETSGAVGPYISISAVAVAVDADSGTVFASTNASPSGATWIIDASTNSVADTIQRGGLQIAADTATGSAYAAPYTAQTNAVWELAPSAANAWSPVIKSTSATFAVGTSGSFAIVGSALPAATYTETGALPSGVTLSPSGVFSGTPAAGTGGSYPVTLTATNGVPPDYSETFTLTVSSAPVITSADNATFDAGVAGSFTMTAAGSPSSVFSETGALPAGITLSSNGVLSGIPASGTGGVYPIQVTATNSAGTATQAFSLTIDEAPAITSTGRATFLAGLPGTFSVSTIGYPKPSFSETGALPAGVSFGGNGVLSGTAAIGTSGSYPIQVTASNSVGTATQAFTLTVDGDSFVPVGPVRVLDTRNRIGHAGVLIANNFFNLQVAGVDGVPATGVSAVVLNVTVVSPTAASFVTVFPDATIMPNASNLNFTAGETISNLVVVPVGTDGMINFYNHAGSVNLVADLAGYYTSGTGSSFMPTGPTRALDTRNAIGHSGAVGPNGTISLQVTGANGVPATGVTAVVLNVTAVSPTAASYVTVFPDGQARPNASNLNFTAGETIPNLVIVPVGADGKIDFYNHVGSVNLIADLAGYYIT